MAKILVCDDDKDIVEAIDIYLTQEGYEVLKAYDGDEAIKVLKSNEVDLLIMDVMMPRLDGIGRHSRSGKHEPPDYYFIRQIRGCGQDFRTEYRCR